MKNSQVSSVRGWKRLGVTALSVILLASSMPAAASDWKPKLAEDSERVVGRWIELSLLEARFARTLEARGYGDPEAVRAAYRPTDAHELSTFLSANGGLGSFFGVLGKYSFLDWGDRLPFWQGVRFGSGAGVVTVAVFGGGMVLSVVSTDEGISLPGDQSIRYSLNPERARARAAAAVETENARRQADFVAGLKKTALEISRRLSAVLGIPESEHLEFERAVERKLLQGFRASTVWNARTSVQIDVAAILGIILEDARERIALLDRALDAADRTSVPETAAEARAAYDALIAESGKLASAAARRYRELATAAGDSKSRSFTAEFHGFAVDQEALTTKLKLHRKLVH